MKDANGVETRDVAECTVVLEVNDATSISNEVEAGDHQTFDDALHYVIERGLAEIKRTRQAQEKAKAKTKALGNLVMMLANNPDAAKSLPADLMATLRAAGVLK